MAEKLTDEHVAAFRDDKSALRAVFLDDIRALATEVLESRAAIDAQGARIAELTRERDTANEAREGHAACTAALITAAEGRTAELEAQLKTVLDRESATQARNDERTAKLEAENARLKKALHQIAAFDDTSANEMLAKTERYSWFDEPGSVQIARAALGGNDDTR